MRSLKKDLVGYVDLGIVLMIGIAFAGMAVGAYIIYKIKDSLLPSAPGVNTSAAYNRTYYQVGNITSGFDSALNLVLVAVTIFILAVAISALMLLRQR